MNQRSFLALMALFIVLVIVLIVISAQAAETMPPRGPIAGAVIECGSLAAMHEACRIEPLCCGFIEPEAGKEDYDDGIMPEHSRCEILVIYQPGPPRYYPSCVRTYWPCSADAH